MRLSHFSLLALTSLSLASPVIKCDSTSSILDLLTDLYATVQIYTGAISPSSLPSQLTLPFYWQNGLSDATLVPLSPSSNLLVKSAATAQVGAQNNLITAAITSPLNQISALPHVNASKFKRSLIEQPEKRQVGAIAIAIAALLGLIVVKIFATVGAAIPVLGLGVLVIFTSSLTSILSWLIVTVQVVLNVVLARVITLLNTILGSLALALSGL
jgi:hypothetical protein